MGIISFVNLMKNRKNEDITIKELNGIKRANSNAILLDVRSPQEFKERHLNGAINIPLYELEETYKYKLKNKKDIIIIYCKSGTRSKRAIKILKKHGFENLYNLKNGIDGI